MRARSLVRTTITIDDELYRQALKPADPEVNKIDVSGK